MVRTNRGNGVEELLIGDGPHTEVPIYEELTEKTSTPKKSDPISSSRDEKLARKQEKEAKKQQKKLEKQQKKEDRLAREALKKQRKEEEKLRKKEEKKLKRESKKSLKVKKKSSKKESKDEHSERKSNTTTTTSSSEKRSDVNKNPPVKEIPPEDKIPSDDEDEDDVEENEADEIENDYVGNFEFEEQQEKNSFECLTQELLVAKQNSEIEEVAELLSIDSSAAAALLRYFKWNRDKLLSTYFEDPNKALSASGVVVASNSYISKRNNNTNMNTTTTTTIEDFGMCTVCAEEMTLENSFSSVCSHRFCKDCWSSYLVQKIQEGESGCICCPSYKCTIIIDQKAIKQLVPDAYYQKYFTYLTQSFVDQNERVKWCPAKNCGNAITADMVKGQMVSCRCGHRFCFHCQEEAHFPATCEQVKQWQKKIQDESETQNWISANTQDCPKCKSFIEKNGGCNHMTCRICSYEFCWLCLRDWKGHNDYYVCNRYQKNQKKVKKHKNKEKNKKEMHRIALERYLHYYSRYLNHDRSRAFEKLREDAHKKMQHLQETEATSAQVKFIQEATESLLECRLALKYSYIVGYYLPENKPTKHLFEFQQESLEKTAEYLSEALENPEDKLKVVNRTRAAETTIKHFLEAVMEDEANS